MKILRGTGVKHRLFSMLLIVVTLLTTLSLFTVTASAEALKNTTFKLTVESDVTAFQALIKPSSDWGKQTLVLKPGKTATIGGKTVDTYGGLFTDMGKGTFEFHGMVFDNLETSCQQDFINTLTAEIKGEAFTTTGAQQISDGLKASGSTLSNLLISFVLGDTSADVFTAYKWVAPVLSVLRVILGILAIGIIALLLLSTVLDCVYIGIPNMREIGNKGDSNGGTDKKPWGISYDAYKTVMDVESNLNDKGSYKNPFFVYFKRRAMTYIILALCLFYLIAGELSGLIGWLLSLVSGITG